MDVHLRKLAAGQVEVVAAWQLLASGWSRERIRHQARSRGWRRIHSGVWVLSQAPPTQQQLWWAAALSTPTSFLGRDSAGASYGFQRFDKPLETVVRPGDGGPRRVGRLLVYRSMRLHGDTGHFQGIPITSPERTLVDITGGLTPKQAGRCFREAVRLGHTTAPKVAACTERHRGPALLAQLTSRYASLPYARCRSDAEARALELLHDAGAEPPAVNVRIAGEEADLAWLDRQVIVEIDGPQYHRFRDEDARKTALWREAGFDVRRAPSSLVYDDAAGFVALCLG